MEYDFYEASALPPNFVEKGLAEVEGKVFEPMLRRTLEMCCTRLVLRPERSRARFPRWWRIAWAELLLLQYKRTRSAREIFRERHKRLANEMPDIADYLNALDPDELHAERVLDPSSFAEIVENWSEFKFGVWKAPRNRQLVTSDAPVFMSFERNNGFGTGRPHLHFPMSPDWCLVAAPTDSPRWDSGLLGLPEHVVDYLNIGQIASAHRWILGDQLELVRCERWLEKAPPEYREGHVPIFHVPPSNQ